MAAPGLADAHWRTRGYFMSRELELVAGRLCDSPGCAASANP